EELDQRRYHSRPSRLVARAQSRPVIPVEVLVEEDVVAPVGVGLKLLGTAVYGPAAALVAQEDAGESVRDVLGDLEEIHHLAGTGRAFDLERVTVVQVEVQERSDEQGVDRHPDRSAPVGVAAEHAGVGLGREVAYPVLLAAHLQDIGVALVEL